MEMLSEIKGFNYILQLQASQIDLAGIKERFDVQYKWLKYWGDSQPQAFYLHASNHNSSERVEVGPYFVSACLLPGTRTYVFNSEKARYDYYSTHSDALFLSELPSLEVNNV